MSVCPYTITSKVLHTVCAIHLALHQSIKPLIFKRYASVPLFSCRNMLNYLGMSQRQIRQPLEIKLLSNILFRLFIVTIHLWQRSQCAKTFHFSWKESKTFWCWSWNEFDVRIERNLVDKIEDPKVWSGIVVRLEKIGTNISIGKMGRWFKIIKPKVDGWNTKTRPTYIHTNIHPWHPISKPKPFDSFFSLPIMNLLWATAKCLHFLFGPWDSVDPETLSLHWHAAVVFTSWKTLWMLANYWSRKSKQLLLLKGSNQFKYCRCQRA